MQFLYSRKVFYVAHGFYLGLRLRVGWMGGWVWGEIAFTYEMFCNSSMWPSLVNIGYKWQWFKTRFCTMYISQCQLPMYVPRFNSIIFGQISSSSETWWNKFCWVKLPPLKRNIILQHWPFYTTLKALHMQVVFIWPWNCVHMIIWPWRVKIMI